jgi:hypothetical protein
MTMINVGDNEPPRAEDRATERFVELLKSNNPDLAASDLRLAKHPGVSVVAGWMVDVDLNAPPPSSRHGYLDGALCSTVHGSTCGPYLRLDLHWMAPDRVMLSIVSHVPGFPSRCRRWIPVLPSVTNAVFLVALDKSCSAILRSNGHMAVQPGLPIADQALDLAADAFFRLWRLCVPLRAPFPPPLAVGCELGAF